MLLQQPAKSLCVYFYITDKTYRCACFSSNSQDPTKKYYRCVFVPVTTSAMIMKGCGYVVTGFSVITISGRVVDSLYSIVCDLYRRVVFK